jgi:hypothetical protein
MIERQEAMGATRPDSRRRVRSRAAAVAVAAVCTLGAATGASAQTGPAGSATTIGGLIEGLFRPEAPFNPDQETLVSEADFNRRQFDSREGIAIGVGNALSAFPLGASSAGFTYLINQTTGERQLKAVSFGPVFVERALTNGKGVFNAGFAYQAAYFDTLQGINVKDDGFPVFAQVGTYLSDSSAVGDMSRAVLDINSKVFLVAGSYGVTDNFDVGFSVPVVSLSVRGRYLRDYNGGLDWERDQPNGPVRTAYPNKIGTETRVDRTIDANGVGDIVLRGKYAFGPPAGQRVLISGDVRLPTGDEENLLGAGKASVRMIVGTSSRIGENASFNANGGYTVGGLTDEINFSAGTEVAVLPSKQLTLTLDFIGQNLRDTVTSVNQMVSFDRVLPVVPDPTGQTLQRRVVVQYGYWERGSTTLLRAAIGAKYAIGGNWLLTGSALFRLNDNGFQAKIVPFIGLEHTWSGQ